MGADGAAADPEGARRGLVRRVGAFTAACLLVSNMIGTGIFGTTGFMARDLGSPALILGLWALGCVYALLGALSYGELGAALPRAGGEYVYITRAWGRLPGFLSGWTSLTIGFSAAIASNAHLFAHHVRELFPVLVPAAPLVVGEAGGWQELLARGHGLELGMVWALTAVHLIGLGAGGLVQNLLTTIKVGALLLLVVAGAAVGSGDWSHFSASPELAGAAAEPGSGPGLTTALVSFLFVTFSYSGWNGANYIAGEMKDPGRSLPRAMVLGTLTVGGLYLAINAIYFYALPIEALAGERIELVGAKSAQALFGDAASGWFTGLLTVSILGAASAMIWAGPRVTYAMAEDGVFPRFFAGTTRSSVPGRAIVLQGLWTSALVIWGEFETLIAYAGFVLILFAALAVAGVIVLRRREPDLERPYRARGYPWTPALYLVLSVATVWATLVLRPREAWMGLLTVAAGLPLYWFWNRSRAPKGPGSLRHG